MMDARRVLLLSRLDNFHQGRLSLVHARFLLVDEMQALGGVEGMLLA